MFGLKNVHFIDKLYGWAFECRVTENQLVGKALEWGGNNKLLEFEKYFGRIITKKYFCIRFKWWL